MKYGLRKCGKFGIMDFFIDGMNEWWNDGLMERRNDGMTVWQKVGMMELLSNIWYIGMMECGNNFVIIKMIEWLLYGVLKRLNVRMLER